MKKIISCMLAVIFILAQAAFIPALAADTAQNAPVSTAEDLKTWRDKVSALFMDNACANLAYGVTLESVQELEREMKNYPEQDTVAQAYIIDSAYAALGISGHDDVSEPMTLSQRGNTWTERSRTLLWQYMYGHDVTDRYARPDETIRIFADFDPKGPAPRVVFAGTHDLNNKWYKGFDGVELKNGYNEITCTDMIGCQTIYFYNPALPDAQAYPPTVRLIGGTKYPVYHYNTENPELSDSEEEFFAELEEYCKDVTDWEAEANSGEGKFNVCSLVSDNMIVVSSARAALKGLRPGLSTTNKVTWNGRTYQGPKDLMELYEGQVEFYIHMAGYNMDDPTSSDYRPRGSFQWRVYKHGNPSALAWAAGVYVAFNAHDTPDGDPLDGGYFQTILSPVQIVQPGWAVYHELGHVFDSSVLGKVEVTNNIVPMMAQTRYMGTNRYDYPSEDRWRSMTQYTNTGVYRDVAYPLGLMVQLEAIDFSDTTLYPESGISNTGRAYRYARQHNAELQSLEKTDDKMLVSFSMALGVNLTPVFDFYGVPISDDAKWLVNNLPLYEKPVQYIRTRAFHGEAFSQAQKKTAPVVTTELNMTAGTLSLNMDKTPYLDENGSDKDILCYEIYRQDMTADPNGEPEFLGISSDDYYGQNPSASQIAKLNLYKFTDTDIYPNHEYKYVIYAYDCTLEKTVGKEITVSTKTDANIPITSLTVNPGTTQVQLTQSTPVAKLVLDHSPKTATTSLENGAVTWTASPSGYVTIERDAEYPDDTSRFVVRLNDDKFGSTQTVTVTATIDGAKNYGKTVKTTYKAVISDAQTSLTGISLDRTSMSMAVGQEVTLNVQHFPALADDFTPFKWESSNDTLVEVDDSGNVKAVGAGIATVTVSTTDNFTGVTFSDVCTIRIYESEEGNASQVYIDRSLFHQDPDGTLWLTKEDFVPDGFGTINLAGRFTTVPDDAQNKGEAKWSVIGGAPLAFGMFYPADLDFGGKPELYYYIEGYFDLQLKIGDVTDTVRVEIRADDAPDALVISDIKNSDDPGEGISEYELKNIGNPVTLYVYTKNNDNVSMITDTKNIAWTLSNDNVVELTDIGGTFTAKAPGTVTVTAAYKGKTASCQITVAGDPTLEYVRIPKSPSEMFVGDTYQVIALPYPSNSKHLENTVFELVSGEGVIALDKTGLVTALQPGKATVKATIVQNANSANKVVKTSELTVTVKAKEIPLTGVAISKVKHQMEPDESLTLTLSPRPLNANSGFTDVTWESSADAIATVEVLPNGEALIIPKSAGIVTITGKMGKYSQSCKIAIYEANPNTLKAELGWDGEAFAIDFTPNKPIDGEALIEIGARGEEPVTGAFTSDGIGFTTTRTNTTFAARIRRDIGDGTFYSPVVYASIYDLLTAEIASGAYSADSGFDQAKKEAAAKVINDGGIFTVRNGSTYSLTDQMLRLVSVVEDGEAEEGKITYTLNSVPIKMGIKFKAEIKTGPNGEKTNAESTTFKLDTGTGAIEILNTDLQAIATVYLEDIELVFVPEVVVETENQSDVSNASEFQDIL